MMENTMTPEEIQTVLKHLSGASSQTIATALLDLSMARAENEKLTAKVSELEEKLEKLVQASNSSE
jgi:hypothetical protein